MLVGLAAAALYATGVHAAAHVAAILYVLAAVLDHVDGELARLTGKMSAAGEAYDRRADLVVRLALFAGMGLGLRHGPLGMLAPALGLVAGVGLVLIFVLRSALARHQGREAFAQPSIGGWDLEDVLYLIGPVTWLGWLGHFVVGASIGTPLFACWVARKYWRATVPQPDDVPVPVSFTYLGLVAGLALFVAFIVHQGVHEVGAALTGAGSGLLVVALFHLVPMLGDALGWRALLPRATRPRVATMLAARWIGEAVNALLPAVQLGGNVAKARFLARRGVPGAAVGASVVVDVTLVMATQVVFALVGVALLFAHMGPTRLTLAAAAGAGVVVALLAVVVAVQRRAPFTKLARLLSRVVAADREEAVSTGAAIDSSATQLYRDRSAILTAAAWHLFAWIVGAGEIWLALHFLGHPVDVRVAVFLESLAQVVRTGAFVIPGALGAQEGAFLVLGRALGLPPETALALSLTRRIRDLVLGLPGLIAWQVDGVFGQMLTRRRVVSS
jgi:putative membrane protein